MMGRRRNAWAGPLAWLGLIAAAWLAAAGSAYGQADEAAVMADGVGTPTARLVRLEGTADIIDPDDGTLVRELAVGDDLQRGDTVAISDQGRAVLYLTDGSRLFLAGGTELRLHQIYFAPGQDHGRLAASVLAGLALVEPGGLARLPEPAIHLGAGEARLAVAGRARAWLVRQGDSATAGVLGEGRARLAAGGAERAVTAEQPVRATGRQGAPQPVPAESAANRAAELATWPAG